MNDHSSANAPAPACDLPPGELVPVPHPLARALAARLAGFGRVRVLLIGIGSGRNLAAFGTTGTTVDTIEIDELLAQALATEARPYDGALSTHALLHGEVAQLAAAIATVRARLVPGGLFYTTLGSVHDRRFGRGRRLASQTFAAVSGSERGIPHSYLEAPQARALFAEFEVESLDEIDASQTAGAWAHDSADRAGMVHWFVRARRPETTCVRTAGA